MTLPNVPYDSVCFICIGTDRSTGDSFGPLVGTALEKKGYQVFGTLKYPVHAMNLEETIAKLPKGKTIIAVDAALGKMESVGNIKVEAGAIKPGTGVGKELPSVGDYRIKGVVNVGGYMEYLVLQNTRLNVVMEMVDKTIEIIAEAYPVTPMVYLAL